LVFSAIGLRSLLYGGQASSSKTTIQEVKVKKETKSKKVVLHLVKVKEEITNLKVELTSNEAIFSYIDKIYIKKFSKYIYYCWVVKSTKSSLVLKRKGNHKQWVVTKFRSQIFIPTAYTKPKMKTWFGQILKTSSISFQMLKKKNNMHKLLTLNSLNFYIHGLISRRTKRYLLLVMHKNP
jgi:hypothetical protein